ncbi:MAG: glycosyltransferase [Burkholderiales bacterium]|nr:glycosyltransferase [Burkholderiales bacterium]MDE1925760.1 glycosyltransferase [Burkholderiales bacterium]MDE2504924.1 glycosyltransferase [Burkholderiales bacterium]
MSVRRPRLVFVSPLFLYPADAGGKIRTTNILRGLKGGAFEITLLSPAAPGQAQTWRAEIDGLCDHYLSWPAPRPRPNWRRAFDLFDAIPANVVPDRVQAAITVVRGAVEAGAADLVVFDFVHSSVLKPERATCKTLCFTHNVEAEIFARHAEQASDALRRRVWASQHAKMVRFEAHSLRGYDKVIAVSERDARHFASQYGVAGAEAIPTGVDLDYFAWQEMPGEASDVPTVVFTGSMDSAANRDGVEFFLDAVWPQVAAALPQARFVVVGRNPPPALVARGRSQPGVDFTGFVDDVRPYLRSAQVSVIPLRVGGGTRIKAFEAMSSGSPVVSTALGVEGLEVEPGVHFLQEDGAAGFAAAVIGLLRDADARRRLARAARTLVESRFGHRVAARAFEDICLRALHAAPAAGA